MANGTVAVVKQFAKTEWTWELMANGCDVLVVGAGPAGLAAAWRIVQSGLRASVVDDNPAAGGQIWRGEQAKPSSAEAQEWFERIRSVDIQMINGARVFQQPEAGMLQHARAVNHLNINAANSLKPLLCLC